MCTVQLIQDSSLTSSLVTGTKDERQACRHQWAEKSCHWHNLRHEVISTWDHTKEIANDINKCMCGIDLPMNCNMILP